MCQLEDNGEQEAQKSVHQKKTEQCWASSQSSHWNQQIQGHVDGFRCPELHMVSELHAVRIIPAGNFLAAIGFKIQRKEPEQTGNQVQEPDIKMLIFVKWAMRLMRAHPEQSESVDILVRLVDIGKGVMIAIVLLCPVVAITTNEVEGHRHQAIDLARTAERFMCTVVHDIEPDQCCSYAMQCPGNVMH